MGQRLCMCGSTKRKALLDTWKSGQNSTWEIYINPVEVNQKLVKENIQRELELAKEKSKAQEIEDKQKEVEAELLATRNQLKEIQEENDRLLQSNKRLSSTVAQDNTPRKKRRELSTVSRQQQWSRKKQIHTDVSQALLFLEDEGVKASHVALIHAHTNKTETLDLNSGTYHTSSLETNINNDDDDDDLVLYVKDRFGLSDAAYHELSMVCEKLPRSWRLKHLAKHINSKYEIKPCPNNVGVQQSLCSKLKERTRHMLQKETIRATDVLQVKLSGDGTKICRKLNLINFTFTLLNEEEIAMSPKGNHTIAIINGSEKYDTLKAALADIIKEVAELTEIEVNGIIFKIEYFLCSDLKFLALICGIEAANSIYSCIWCKCSSADRHDMKKEWSISDTNKGARTIQDIISCHTKPKPRNFNCSHPPLFCTIPIHHVIPDVLHLFLRVTDVLFDLLVMDIRRHDAIEKSKHQQQSNLERLEEFLNKTCKIPFKFSPSRDTKELKWRDLMGPEKLAILNNISLFKELFPQLPKIQDIFCLWKDYKALHEMLHQVTISSDEIKKYETDVKKWVDSFTSIYQSKNVTPYMHIMAKHVPEFFHRYGSLVKFTQQGMEKLNDQTTIDYAKSTNHNFKNLDALTQLLQKRNRVEYLEDNGCQRNPRDITCSICHTKGHNKVTCKQKVTT